MDILKIILTIIFVITISGAADTYWGQNKGRSMEGALVKSTKFLAVLFIVLALVLNLKFFN